MASNTAYVIPLNPDAQTNLGIVWESKNRPGSESKQELGEILGEAAAIGLQLMATQKAHSLPTERPNQFEITLDAVQLAAMRLLQEVGERHNRATRPISFYITKVVRVGIQACVKEMAETTSI